MTARWLVTPFFLDEHDPALAGAVPAGPGYRENNPGAIPDRSATSLARTHEPIAKFVHETVLRDDLPVSIAGDCAASLPVMAGLQRAGLDPALLWLDAHGDFNTPEISVSGFLGGMPLAMMVGRGDLSLPRAVGQVPVREDRVWLCGARDLDPPEQEALDASYINRVTPEALNDLVVDRVVHLHIDNDVIDASEVPANNYPVARGPSLQAIIRACVAFAASNRLCAISLSGWNGRLDRGGRTRRACGDLLAAIVGASK